VRECAFAPSGLNRERVTHSRLHSAVQINLAVLAETLAGRLNSALPEETWVEAHGAEIAFYANDGWYGADSLDWGWDDDRGTAESLVFVVERLLDSVQDTVAHATRGVAWPPPDPKSPSPLPLAWAQVRDEQLRFGFGSDQSPIVFAPISLAAIVAER
jgi:hypothetical protein